MMRKLGKLWLWIVYAFLFLPIFVVIAYSFNAAKYTSAWKGFTLKWYSQLFGNAALIDAVVNTLSVAALAALLATLLGVLAALCLKRTEFPGRQLLHASLYVLTVSPEMVMGISLLIFFISVKLPLGFVSMLIAHTTLGLPFVALTVLARLAEFDEHLVEAARDLGATEAQAFRYVILPVIMPAVVAGWLLAFTLSMDDVLISFFVAGPTFEVLPLRIYSMVRLGVKPDINALSAIMFCVTIALVVLAFCLSRPRKSLRKQG
ncbi:spermidine/putrescine ABC transporter permease PotC [uncultured Bilophila sp.]|uniref:spermidine/putrescine ABC transporter permease PotC n=1 Tax=uncultured Bilophila sp. TaxID=529385 RepID=UPI0025957AF8|nr:spermidine/putrescine ABC transporter permease PotC [uncultured Bilophila sp.]